MSKGELRVERSNPNQSINRKSSRWSLSFKAKMQVLISFFLVILIGAIAAALIFTEEKVKLLPEKTIILLEALDEVNDIKFALQRQRIEWAETLIMIYSKSDYNEKFNSMIQAASAISNHLVELKSKLPTEMHEGVEEIIAIQKQVQAATQKAKNAAGQNVKPDTVRDSVEVDDLLTKVLSSIHKISDGLVEISIAQQIDGVLKISRNFKMVLWALVLMGISFLVFLSIFLQRVSRKIFIITEKALQVASASKIQSQTL